MDSKNTKGKKIAIMIPAELPLSPKVREFVISFLKQEAKFSNIWIGRLALMVDEMVNNAIEHWSNWSEDSIDISIITMEDNSLKIIVEDMWKDWKKIKAKDLEKQIKINLENKNNWIKLKTWIRGRWLSHIVSVLSDSFNYVDNEKWWLTWIIYKKFNSECADIKESNAPIDENKIKVQTITL